MLVVDTSVPALREQKKALEKVGISVFRIDTMQEAIVRMMRGEEYLCVVINEDSIPDFMTLLPVMSDVAKTQLFVTSHSYTKAKQTKAMRAGADAYVPFGETAMEDVECCLLHLELPARWAQRPAKQLPVLIGNSIILSKHRRCVFVDGKEIPLTTKEFDILLFMMENHGLLMTYQQIMNYAWKDENAASSPNAISHHVKRFRKKVTEIAPDCAALIISIPGRGYQFIG